MTTAPRNLFSIDFQRLDPGKESSYHADTSHLFDEDNKKSEDKSRSNRLRTWISRFVTSELLVYKVFYFFFHAATAMFAYLPLYYKESLLLDHHHVGFLMGVRPFCEFLGAPCLGTFADKFNKYKSTLYSGLFAYIVVYLSITFVNGVPKDCGVRQVINATNVTNGNISLTARGNRLSMLKRSTKVDESAIHDSEMVTVNNKHTTRVSRQFNELEKNVYKAKGKGLSSVKDITGHGKIPVGGNLDQSQRFSKFPFLKTSSAFLDDLDSREVKTSDPYSSFNHGEVKEQFPINRKSVVRPLHQLQMPNNDLNKHPIESSEDQKNKLSYFEPGGSFNLTLTEGSSRTYKWLENPPETAGENAWPMDVYRGETKDHDTPEQKNVREHIFMILLLLTIAAELLGAPILSLADTATLQCLRKEPYRYGHQKVWSSVGFGLMSIATGSVLHYTVSTKDEIKNCPEKMGDKYRPVFYSCCLLLLLAFLTTIKFRFRVYEGKDTSGCSFFRCLKYFQNVEYFLFAFLAWFTGLAGGLTDSFLFVHLIRLGATPLILVVTTTVQSVSKVIFFYLSPMLIVKYGYFPVIYAGLVSSVITFFYYSFLESPWMVVPIEILAGLSSSCVWAALASYVGAPPKIGATLQGILHAIHIGLGRGIGGLFGGMILVNYGFDMLFRSFSLAILLVGLIVFGVRYWRKDDVEPIWSKLWDYSPVAPYDENSNDH